MLRWLDMLAGPLIWAMHFAIVYGIASASIQANGDVTQGSRTAIVIAGVVLAPSLAIIAFLPRRGRPTQQLHDVVRMSGAVIAIVAIIWQTLPILLS